MSDSIDLSFPLEPIFTNGLVFYQALVESTKSFPPGIVRIGTYNTSINEGMTESVHSTLTELCKVAIELRLLVGINPHHPELSKIRRTLNSYKSNLPKLHIRELRGVHMKCFLTPSCGYAGSLNLIHPTLDDLMVRLTTLQRRLVVSYFDRLWTRASAILPVQKLNNT